MNKFIARNYALCWFEFPNAHYNFAGESFTAKKNKGKVSVFYKHKKVFQCTEKFFECWFKKVN